MLLRFHRNFLLAVGLALFTAVAQADIKLPDPEGKTHTVGDYLGKGQWTVVMIWSVDCPICKKDIHHMAFFHDEHKNREATVLGISIDGTPQTKRVQEFIRHQSLTFPNLIGTVEIPEKLSRREFIGTPTYYIFDPKGKFATQIVGPVTKSQMERYIKILKDEQGKKGS